ncbi:hypothetical protein [Nostoc sp. MG11]|uniref:hypothetical protein n=1 Tax=Nostoc sp. MG11 TaxID=2721166 RepID=UPI0018665FA4|nr:hypothetical protein [Nostoc sp. MG11]
MSDINPRQFISLDYANADLYQGLNNRTPPPAVPLNLPLPELANIAGSAEKTTAAQLATAREELARQRELGRPQREAQAQREADLAQRQQAWRNQMAEKYPSMYKPQPTGGENALGYDYLYKPNKSTTPTTPSTASPPPTLNNTSARASSLVEPTATPAPAALKEAIPTATATAGGVAAVAAVLPRSLPQAAGRLAVPGVFAVADFGSRVIQGQPVGQAAGSALITSGLGTAGWAVGSFYGGPVGGAVGALVGGFIASKINDFIFGRVPISSAVPPIDPVVGKYPFLGGQAVGARYWVKANATQYLDGQPYQIYAINDQNVYGPIEAIDVTNNYNETGVPVLFVKARDISGNPNTIFTGGGWAPRYTVGDLRNINVTLLSGIDNNLNPAPAPIVDTRTPASVQHPANQESGVASGVPGGSSVRPLPAIGVGGGNTINPSPRGDTPGWIPHAYPEPRRVPNPNTTPQGLGMGLPDTGRLLPDPRPFAEPEDVAVPRTRSSGSTTIYTDLGRTPSPSPEPVKPVPFNDAQSPTPKVQSQFQPKTSEQAKSADDDKKIKDLNDEVTRLGAAIAAITTLINKIPSDIAKSPDIRAANKDDIQGAVCEIAQPGGCLGAPIKKAEDAAKGNATKIDELGSKLDALNLGSNAAQLALLTTIDNKIGDQLPGGLAGKLSRFADWMHLDRVLNILILGATIHNGLMLSNDIGQTFLGIINNVLTLIGLKKEDGSSFDIGSVISTGIENLIKGAIGAENYQELTAAWAKANRIYQATTNVLNSFLNLSQTILQASELIAAYTGKIGNALKKGGVILESAYGWMNPQPKFNRVTQFLEGLQNGASTIQMVTQAPLDIINATTELTTASTEFVKAVKEDDKPANKASTVPEPDELKAKEIQSKTNSQPNPFDFLDLFDGED